MANKQAKRPCGECKHFELSPWQYPTRFGWCKAPTSKVEYQVKPWPNVAASDDRPCSLFVIAEAE